MKVTQHWRNKLCDWSI